MAELSETLQKASYEQLTYINDLNCTSNNRLLATAGSGKTFSIIVRAWNMIERGVLKPDQVLILTFSRQARFDFVRKVHDMGAPLLPFNIRTIDSFARQVIDTACRVDVSILSYTLLQFLEHATDDDLAAKGELNKLAYLFVDEAQDLNSTQYGIVLALAKRLGLGVSLVGDPNQNIYQFRGGSDVYLKDFPAHDTYMLTHNYRSFRHIVEYASHLRPYQNADVHWTKEASNQASRVIMHGHDRSESFEKSLLAVIGRLRERGVPYHRMAVLAPTRGSLSLDGRHKGLCHVANIFALAGVPAAQLYDDSGGLDAGSCSESSRPVDQRKDHITLMTYTASKGLEWDYVMLVDANAYLISRADYTREQFEAEQYLLYVAATRAKKALHVFSNRTATNPWLALVPKDVYHVAGCPERLTFADPKSLNFMCPSQSSSSFQPETESVPVEQSVVGTNGEVLDMDSIASRVYCLGEELLYFIDSKFSYNVTCTQQLTTTFANVPTGRMRFLARLARTAFMDAYNASIGQPPDKLLHLEAVLDGERVIITDNAYVAQWHARRKEEGWETYNSLRACNKVPQSVAKVLDNLNQNISLHEYTIVSDKFYHTHVTNRLPAIRESYTLYIGRTPGQISAKDYIELLFRLTALEYALATTHYFYSVNVDTVFGACACTGNIEHIEHLQKAAISLATEYSKKGPRIVFRPPFDKAVQGTVDFINPQGIGLFLHFTSNLRLQDILCAATHQALLSEDKTKDLMQLAIFNLANGSLQVFKCNLPQKVLYRILASKSSNHDISE